MKFQASTHLKKTIMTFSAALFTLFMVSACTSQTAQAPAETAPAQSSPGVDESPTATTSPTPTTSPTDGTSPTANNERSIADVAASTNSLSTLTAAIKTAGLTDTLKGQGSYTVFAPSNTAFSAVPTETLKKLLQPENRAKLQQVLSYHVIPRKLSANQLQSGSIDTVAGKPLTIQVTSGTQQVKVNTASITQPNIQASNGVIHIIDQVILPPDFKL